MMTMVVEEENIIQILLNPVSNGLKGFVITKFNFRVSLCCYAIFHFHLWKTHSLAMKKMESMMGGGGCKKIVYNMKWNLIALIG